MKVIKVKYLSGNYLYDYAISDEINWKKGDFCLVPTVIRDKLSFTVAEIIKEETIVPKMPLRFVERILPNFDPKLGLIKEHFT